jgi:hypothetical protein
VELLESEIYEDEPEIADFSKTLDETVTPVEVS